MSKKYTADTIVVGGVITTAGGNSTNWNAAHTWVVQSSASVLTSSSLTGYATQTYVNTQVNNLVASAPGTLDTLNELASALGDDPNFATTVTNSIAGKLPLTGGTLTGNITASNLSGTNTGDQVLTGLNYAATNHNHDLEYLPMSYTDIDMDTYDGDKSMLLGRNLGGWSSGTKPSGAHNGFGILHVTTHTGGYATQFGFDTNQNKIWVRSRNPATWNTWQNMWTSTDFTSTNISNWNTAHGWGDHSTAGYLTSVGTYNTVIGTDTDIDTSGSTIIDNIYMTDGVITSHGTRTLTLGNLGYTGATNANYITNNTQLTNGQNYITAASNVATATNLASIGTSFNGVHPMTVNANGVIYSHTGITFQGNTGSLVVSGQVTAGGNVNTAGDIVLKNTARIKYQENVDVTGLEEVATVPVIHTAVFFDYVVKKGTNVRAGTLTVCHDGTNVEYVETSTIDLGNTSDVELTADMSAGKIRMLAESASANWSIKSLIRAI